MNMFTSIENIIRRNNIIDIIDYDIDRIEDDRIEDDRIEETEENIEINVNENTTSYETVLVLFQILYVILYMYFIYLSLDEATSNKKHYQVL